MNVVSIVTVLQDRYSHDKPADKFEYYQLPGERVTPFHWERIVFDNILLYSVDDVFSLLKTLLPTVLHSRLRDRRRARRWLTGGLSSIRSEGTGGHNAK